MSKIVIRGPWGWAWGAWHALLVAGLVWAVMFAGSFARWFFRIHYTIWAALEIPGAIQNYRKRGEDVNTCRTMSEFRQFIAQVGKGPWPVGWKGLAAGSAFIDAGIVGWAVYDIHPWLGAATGTVLFLWLAAHFAYREVVG